MLQRKHRTPGGRLGAVIAGLLASGSAALASPAHAQAHVPAPPPVRAPAPAPGQAAQVTAPAGTPAGTPAAAPAARDPRPDLPGAMGAFLESGPAGVARMAQLERWLGGRELRAGHTYLPGDQWAGIDGPPGLLEPWAAWRARRAHRMLVLNVPMLTGRENGTTDRQVRSGLRLGASGAYDDHFRTLAERLVALRAPDTHIVLGWEMNGTTYAHRCAPDPTAWKTYWKRVVAVMRSVPGQRFRFDFAPSRGLDAIAWTVCYPGDDVVDVIGMDTYDQPPGTGFDQHVDEPFGLRAQVDFAALHGKPISYPEWGLFRNGDNPEYIRRMLDWMRLHPPVYHTITDYCPHGVWQCGSNPRSSRVFRQLLYGTGPQVRQRPKAPQTTGAAPTHPVKTVKPRKTAVHPVNPVVQAAPKPAPAPDSVPDPVPEPRSDPRPEPKSLPSPPPAADCRPVKPGSWVESWIGGPVCAPAGSWQNTLTGIPPF